MNKIKSERAKAHIKNHTFDCENVDTIERHLCPSDARQAIRIAEKDAEERAVKAFEEAKERIKAAVRLTFNGCLDSQLLERRMLIFNDLLNEINNGGQSDE